MISLLAAPQNLAAYSELGVRWSHHPIPTVGDQRPALESLFTELAAQQAAGEVILVHDDELGDRTIGVIPRATWSGRVVSRTPPPAP